MKMLWLRFLRWYHWYNSGTELLILGDGTAYFVLGRHAVGTSTFVDVEYSTGWATLEDGPAEGSWSIGYYPGDDAE